MMNHINMTARLKALEFQVVRLKAELDQAVSIEAYIRLDAVNIVLNEKVVQLERELIKLRGELRRENK